MDLKFLSNLFENKYNSHALSIQPLPLSGSARRYFRLVNNDRSVIGVYNADIRENKAFISFTEHFLEKGLSVPQIYATDQNLEYYLLEDLGDTTLKDYADSLKKGAEIPQEVIDLYKKALSELVHFQVEAHKGLDYSLCIPRDTYDRQSVLWDLNYFKSFFLKVSGIPFDEQQLENDFQAFADLLTMVDTDSFLFRDFQSRNIMIHHNKLIFIDYQGGRKGALQYDPASLLFEAKTKLPHELREYLLEYYLDELCKQRKIDRAEFKKFYYPFAMIRMLQALGAYGLRGLIEKKPFFIQSIPLALNNLDWIIENTEIPVDIPELIRVSRKLITDKKYTYQIDEKPELLTIRIYSFSYRKGIPDDLSGNGGGFVFDCRGIHNPGRYPEYRGLTGKDAPVKLFLDEKSKMNDFLLDVESMVSRHIEFFKENDYYHMQISFGCTGGQHRSVYAAEKITEALNKRKDICVLLQHNEI